MIAKLMPGKWSRSLFGAAALLFLFSASASCWSQAPIEPSLPPAPLPHRRVLWLFPGYETIQDPTIPVAPLQTRQKFEMAYRKTIDVSFPIESVMFAGADKVANYGPNYGTGSNAFGQLVGYNAANLASTFFFTDALLPTIFHQDPRYFRKGAGTDTSRVWWALRSEFVAFNNQGVEVPNYSGILGFGMATALSNAYSPPSSVTLPSTMERFGVKIGVSFALNVMREFGGISEPEKHQLQPIRRKLKF